MNDSRNDYDFNDLIESLLSESGQATFRDENSPLNLLGRIVHAAKRFSIDAFALSKAFLISAATGKASPELELPRRHKLKVEIQDLLNQLRWLEKANQDNDPDDLTITPQRLWASQTLATAMRLKILLRAADFCRLSHNVEGLQQIQVMHHYYLNLLAQLQHPVQR
ncbi:MAG: hypothetical protein Q8K75_01210 [Chlamydiales bacterium]|nr:hypothetical protein [Chlamydiales bacterium]